MHVAFVDLKAAFDSVDRNALWKAMRGIGVPSVLMDLIIDLHTATSARVRDCIWSQSKLSISTKLRIYSTCVLPILYSTALRPGLSYKLIGKDWISSMYAANDVSCTYLSSVISAQFTLDICVAACYREKFTKTPYFCGSGSFRVIEVGTARRGNNCKITIS